MRIESAGRMEFRRQREHVEVFNDDRQVACIEGSFIAFSKGASLSVDETAAIVEYALRERVNRNHTAHFMTDPDVNGMRRVHRRVGRDTSVAAIGPMGHAHFSLDPTVEDMEAVLYFAKQVRRDDATRQAGAALTEAVRAWLDAHGRPIPDYITADIASMRVTLDMRHSGNRGALVHTYPEES